MKCPYCKKEIMFETYECEGCVVSAHMSKCRNELNNRKISVAEKKILKKIIEENLKNEKR